MPEHYVCKMRPRIAHRTSVNASLDTRTMQKECDTLAQASYRVALIATHSQHEITDRIEIITLPRHASCRASMVLSVWAAFGLAQQLEVLSLAFTIQGCCLSACLQNSYRIVHQLV